jgi:hypothetical protein
MYFNTKKLSEKHLENPKPARKQSGFQKSRESTVWVCSPLSLDHQFIYNRIPTCFRVSGNSKVELFFSEYKKNFMWNSRFKKKSKN